MEGTVDGGSLQTEGDCGWNIRNGVNKTGARGGSCQMLGEKMAATDPQLSAGRSAGAGEPVAAGSDRLRRSRRRS